MDITIALVFFGVGLGLIIFFAEQLVKGVVGSELLVSGAQTPLKRFEISDLPFGMTILAFLVYIEELERELPAARRSARSWDTLTKTS